MRQVGVEVEETAQAPDAPLPLLFDDQGFVDFAVAGTTVSGDFRCADCGYGAVVRHALPPCPMCGGTIWERREPRFVD